MSPDLAIELGKEALTVAVLIAAPILLSALAAGLVIGMFQAATQINEQTMSFVPKLAVMVLTLLIAAPWMLQVLLDFTQTLFRNIPGFIG
ncbi:MAG: flagellar biosynthesis protein FliQ [Nitrococcus sp.]|nr:flagellar biosynthesis protein FliQ [Nitrococcus sp.]